MTADLRSLSLLVHAHSKVGKSTLGATCPIPICTFDAEGGTKFLAISDYLTTRLGRPPRIIPWDPMGPPPAYDGTWDIAVVTITSWHVFTMAANWLASGQHHFASFVIDSITEIQRRLKKQLVGTEQMKMQDWGSLLMMMDDAIRGLRDLANDPYNPIRVAMFIAETRQTGGAGGKFIPYMQGQISISLPYWMDIVGYLYVDMLPDAQGQLTLPQRKLLVNQHPLYEAGERVQGRVGPVIDAPDVHQMLEKIYSYHQQPQETPS